MAPTQVSAAPSLMPDRDRPQIVIVDGDYVGYESEANLTAAGIRRLRSAHEGERTRSCQRLLKPLRQMIE